MRASVGRPMPAFVLTLLERFDESLAILDRLVRAARDYGDRSAAGVFLAERAWARYRAGNAEGAEADASEALRIARDATRARGHAPIAASVAVLAGMERERPFEELEAIVAALPPAGDPDTVVQDDLALARAWLLLAQGDAQARRRRCARARPRGLLGLQLAHAPSVALRGVRGAGAARRGGAGARARPGGAAAGAGARYAARGGHRAARGGAGGPAGRAPGRARGRGGHARERHRAPRAGARDLRAGRGAAPARRAQRRARGAAPRARARGRVRRHPARHPRPRRAVALGRAADPRAGERRRGAHAERGPGGGAGRRGPHEPRGGAGAVRLREDGRDAPRPRLPQARHQVAPRAAGRARGAPGRRSRWPSRPRQRRLARARAPPRRARGATRR